jgi:GxxExxY protein
MESKLIFKEGTNEIIGAAFEVHKELGNGFLESVYHEALEIEFRLRGIPFESGKKINVFYKENKLKKHFVADFLCYGKIIVEIKAISMLTLSDDGQVVNYLKGTKHKVALLFNFGQKSLEFKRLVY